MSIKTVKKIHNPKTNAYDENYLMLYRDDNKEICVPINTDHRYYREIQEWVAEGNTIEDAD